MIGKKIEFMRANPRVSVVVEEHGERRQWKSVIVDGTYEELPDEIGYKRSRDHAWSILSKYNDWWEPGALKPLLPPFVRTHRNLSSSSLVGYRKVNPFEMQILAMS